MNPNQIKNKTINEKELEVLEFWKANKIFEKSLEKPGGEEPKESFSFYDGPPFATGLPHHGHLLAGTIKDAIPRYQTMNGKYVHRVWGWDCHGLPIENLIEKKFDLNSKKEIENFGIDRFNKEAQDSVFAYEKEWKEIIPRFGRFVDMENSYKTLDWTYTESVWWVFKELSKKGLVFEGHKSMHICPRCETTLAQSEVTQNYKDLTDISVTAKFELEGEENTFVLAWTTTPWTLPGNVALAVNKEIEYVKVEASDSNFYIVAKERAEEIFKKQNLEFKIVEEFSGEKIIGKKYKPVFNYFVDAKLENKENIYTIVDAEFVSIDTGTGVVHIAPAFGEDDLNLGKEKKLPIIKHVGMNGEFTKDITDFAGMKVKKAGDNQSADIAIIKYLAEKKLLFAKEKLVHSYPTCWRCDTPLLNYATSSWFIDVPKIKNNLLATNANINWNPENIRDGRFGKWLEGAREWAVSRSRYWGAPLPIWKENDGDEVVVIGSLKELAEMNSCKPKNEYYVMRHGESIHNVEGIEETVMDPKDVLTELGIAQVEDSKKKNEIDFDVIVSSAFPRAYQTAGIMAGEKEVIIYEYFNEIDLGTYNGKTPKEMLNDFGKNYLKLKTKIGGGESHGDVMNRVMLGLSKLEDKYSGKKILIATHGAPMRMMLAAGELMTEEEIIADELSNDSRLYPHFAQVRKLDLKILPRDETGNINLHRPYIDEVKLISKNGKEMTRVEYVFDCWFESGSMPYGQIHYPFENKNLFEKTFPADFIAEGLDQTRGWFYSLLNISVGLFDETSYKNVIVNGMLLAADGEKMSKSKNNFTPPMLVVEKFGADAFRQTLLSSPAMCAENIPFSDNNVEETYKKIVAKLENVLSFYEMLEVSHNFNDDLLKGFDNPLDNWIFTRLNEIIANTTKSMNEYRLDQATRPFDKFIDDLSTWWLRRSRDRLKSEDGVSAEFTLYKVLNDFSKVIAPFMPFLAERIYQSVNKENLNKKESVHLESWPKEFLVVDEKVLEEMVEVRSLVTEALMIRQKNNLPVRQPLSSVTTKIKLDEKYFEILKDEINVKEIILDEKAEYSESSNLFLDLNITEELKKEGEYRELTRKVKDLRKENNLVASDIVSLLVKTNQERKDFILTFKEELMKDCKLSDVEFEESEKEEMVIVK
ncbi:MAG: class I tRNA ligase family protein [Candidatus Nomurabacteria bacterium]